MLQALKKHIETLLLDTGEDKEQSRADGLRLATAALLAEVANADRVLDTRELHELGVLLQQRFLLTESQTREIVNDGLAAAEDAVSLQGFTRTLHEALTDAEKSDIVGMMWMVAYADGELDMHEDAIIAKIGELLYVPRSEVLRLKAVAAAS